MQGTIRKYRIDSGKAITVIQRIQEDLIPLVRRLPGFMGFYVLNREDQLVTINLSADPRQLREADEVATTWMGTLGSSVVLVSQEVISGPVVVEAAAD
ncbi:MAG: hypothetical protein IRZ31_20310 [Thermogemmatispora sp.]|uniref:hypothetical protein n=1 Tax=Thermogemmatispora sp. TaxID=1968838 RepID=UPI00261399D0|nr:hypothetical protein [Thermogemmatispora sp.]MBX5459244.1 hypothetical protein [Thermogemmatispora sp.]